MAICLVLLLVQPAAANSYRDVDGHHYRDAINLLDELGIVQGFPDGTFRPDEPVTREQFVVMIVNMLKQSHLATLMQNAKTSFTDDHQISGWSRGSIALAAGSGMIQGYPDGSFGPQRPVSVVEAYALVLRALNLEPDRKAPWPVGIILVANEIGATDGVYATFEQPATRGDLARILANALQTDYSLDRETGQLVQGDGSKALLVRIWKRQIDEFLTLGTIERITSASNRIVINGRTFTWDQDTKVTINGEPKSSSQISRLVSTGDRARFAFSGERLIRLDVVQPTWEWAHSLEVHLDEGETDYGTVTLVDVEYILGNGTGKDDVVVPVTPDTTVLLNGKPATWADVEDAVRDFHRSYRNRPFLVDVAMANHDRSVSLDKGVRVARNEAHYIHVITDNIVRGTVTGQGVDREGRYLRIRQGSTTIKVYYQDMTPPTRNSVTLLLDDQGVARIILVGGTYGVDAHQIFWAFVSEIERDGADRIEHLRLVTLEGEKNYRVARDWRGNSIVDEIDGKIDYGQIIAVRTNADGEITHVAEGMAYSGDDAFERNDAELARFDPGTGQMRKITSRLWTVPLHDSSLGYIEDSVLIVGKDGEPTDMKLENVDLQDIAAVFVLMDGSVRIVEALLLDI